MRPIPPIFTFWGRLPLFFTENRLFYSTVTLDPTSFCQIQGNFGMEWLSSVIVEKVLSLFTLDIGRAVISTLWLCIRWNSTIFQSYSGRKTRFP